MKRVVSLFLLSALWVCVAAQPLSKKQINRLVRSAMKEFSVPGIAVAVLKDDAVIHMKGYGVRSIATGKKTDEHTLFAIASNTKAFTVAALGILIDEGRLTWETKVIDIIPEFRLYDVYVTEDFNIKDLLTHRSGMGLGAGDLMGWPDSADFSTDEIIHNLRYMKQTSPFRTKYDYDNLLYIVAGEVVARVSGESWEEFVESRIMKPLGMHESSASFTRITDLSNIIDAHVPVDGRLIVTPKQEAKKHNSVGGIYSNIADMSRWVMLHLNRGSYGINHEDQLFTEAVHREMWTPQTIRPASSNGHYRSNFAFYGLGWHLADVNGYLQVYHTGSHAGIVTRVTMLPEIKLGIIVLTNQQETAAQDAITNGIMDGYLGTRGIDHVAVLKEERDQEQKQAREVTDRVWAKVEAMSKESSDGVDLKAFEGTYTDRWFGDVVISEENGRLRFRAVKSPRLKGEIFHYKANTFIVRWDDRTMDADAFAVFALDREGRPSSFTMEAVSPLTDFSFDFQDLLLKRGEN
ncbi:MAG: serine hydrolase [Bacteroidales bacterium]|nr:serine hydrolase [Bacteroidales bacterium]